MKKIVLAGNALVPNEIFLNNLVPVLHDRIAGILVSTKISPSNPLETLRYTWRMFSTSGFRYGLYMMALWLAPKFRLGPTRQLLSIDKLGARYGVPVIKEPNFNSDKTQRILEGLKCDGLLSFYCDQIFSRDMINRSSFGMFNIHPSPLPDFRGIDPVFQQILNKMNSAGITLHEITPGIDEGPILESETTQKGFTNHLAMVVHLANRASVLAGRWIRNGSPLPTSQNSAKIEYPYSSWPSRKQVGQFYRNGGSLWQDIGLPAVGLEELKEGTNRD